MNTIRKRASGRGDEGIALLFALFAALIVLGATALVTLHMTTSKQRTDFTVKQAELDEAAKAGLDAGIAQFWAAFFAQLPQGADPSLRNYRTFLDGIVADNPDGLNPPIDVPGIEFPLDLPSGIADVTQVTVDRVDAGTGSTLTFRSLAEANGVQRAATQSIRVGGTLFEGFEFAVLANNINCILCHADFRNALLEWNNNPATRPTGDANGNGVQDWIDNLGTFERIKVASLESLMVRPSEANSKVAGTVFTGGDLYDQNGNSLSGLESTTFDGWNFSSGHADDHLNGKINQHSSTGAMTQSDLVKATESGGELNPWANLYTGDQTEGLVPEEFPAPYQDDGGGSASAVEAEIGNRMVDDSEFSRIMTDNDGTISGGVMYGVPQGSAYTGSNLPTTSNLGGVNGAYDGNLILVGTPSNPIILDGPVAINGDLVLKGVVRGRGSLQARNNVYVMGDVTYDDNATLGPDGKPFGVHIHSDGTKTENLLGVVAGGSILMGDYLTVRGKNKTSDTSKYPNIGWSIQTRTQNKTGTDSGQTMYYGYFDPGVIDAGEIQSTMKLANGTTVNRDGQQFSFTTSELMLFNELELQKALEKNMAGDNYRARLYGLRESQPGNLYIYDYGDEHAVRYDEGGANARVKKLSTWVNALTTSNSDYSSAEIAMLKTIVADAAVHYMNPAGNWMSEDTLRKAWYDDEMSRTSERPFQFDGLLYSNNAIFSITKSKGRHDSNTYGKMTLRGGIVAPDLGVLTPGGLNLLYDARVKDLYNLEDTANVQMTRRIFRYITPAEVTMAQAEIDGQGGDIQ